MDHHEELARKIVEMILGSDAPHDRDAMVSKAADMLREAEEESPVSAT